jgi:small-conductance mechanosensitive channel
MTTKTLLLLVIILVGYFIGKKALTKLVNTAGKERNISAKRVHYVNSFISIIWTAIIIITIISLSGIGFNDFGLILGSAFALLGVALFAQWSILSNITASIIVFFLFPYRVGDYVKIIDGENSIEGVIKEITLFHVILTDIDQSITTYPNSMVFQKAVKINPASTSKAITDDEQK